MLVRRALCLLVFLLIPVLSAAQINQNEDFTSIDAHAINAPSKAEQSFASLAEYLVQPARNDLERVRSIFRWITQNISYDTKGFFSGKITDASAEKAFKEKKAVCDGYAGLFEQLAKLAKVEVVKISGYSKGYGFIAGGRTDERPNHAWNAVKLEGKWYLMDCTWGAGYVDEQKQFRRQLQNHYFLTPSEEFIYDHFPTDSKWQLLDIPATRDQYDNFVYLRPAFFKTGLKLRSHKDASIRSGGTLKIMLQQPSDALVLSTITQGQKNLEGGYAFCQWTANECEIHCSFPGAGMYIVRIFAKRKTDPGSYEWALDYRVDADAGSEKRYPKSYSAFSERDCFLVTPLMGTLSRGTKQEFRIKAAEAEKVAIIQAGKWSYLSNNSVDFSGIVPVEKGDLQLVAKFPSSDLFQTLLTFTAQ